jgi:hypothetical protein
MKKYENTNLEHVLGEELSNELIISVIEDVDLDIPFAYVPNTGNLKNVAKHYVEEDKVVYILLECSNFDSSMQTARDLGCGVIFECGSKFDNALKANTVQIERLAACNGIAQNYERVASIFANSVPFSMSRMQAEDEINKTIVDQNEAVLAMEIFGSILQKNKQKAVAKNAITLCSNVITREFGYQKFSNEALQALREEMLTAYAAGGVYLWKLPMGIGKTVVINELIELAAKNDEKPAYIAPRVNISRAIKETVASNYLSEAIFGSEHELSSLSICVNSIDKERFKVFLEQSGVIILEEVEQMIAHIAEGVCKNRVQVYNEIVRLIKKARLVVALDANANDEVIQLLKLAYNDIHVLHSRTDNSAITAVFAEESSVLREILVAAESKQKCMIMVELQSQADAVKKIFDEQGLKSLVITADTREFPGVADFIANPNSEILKYNGAIIYNSAMQSSTSIEANWADRVFGMFKGVLRVSDIMQMLRRYRPAKEIVISAEGHGRAAVFNEEINKQYNITSSKSEDFNDTAFRIHKQKIEERKNIRLNLALQIEQDGYKVDYIVKEDTDNNAWSVFRNAAKKVRKETVERTLALAHSGEITSLNGEGINKCQNDIDQQKIIDAAKSIGLELKDLRKLTEDDIKFFTRRDANRVIRNARCWFRDPDFNEIAEADDGKYGIDKNNTRKRKEILSGLISAMGINAEGEGIAEVDKASAYIKSNIKWFEMLSLITAKKVNFETRNQKLAAINNILESMGLGLKRQKVKGEYAYKLDVGKIVKMERYLGLTINIK